MSTVARFKPVKHWTPALIKRMTKTQRKRNAKFP